MTDVVELTEGRGELARAVLSDLPEWFGRPDALLEYVRAADRQTMLALRLDDGRPIGFLSLRAHSPVSAEAYVLGVMRRWHRRGHGRRLFDAAARLLAARGVRNLTVKTLAADHPDPHYAATRAFYEALGFEPLEVFPDLWGAGTPCLLMLKRLEAPAR